MAKTNQKQALGKGIRALLDDMDDNIQSAAAAAGISSSFYAQGASPAQSFRIALDAIEINPKQPRRDFDATALVELSESIKLHDVIQPITVVSIGADRYQLISGERRLRASKMAGLTDIPAFVRTADENQMLELALIENLQREDLNPIEIALSYRQLMDEFGLTQEQVSERMKKERSTVANFLRLLKLPPDITTAVRDGSLSMGHARAILGLEHIEQQLFAFKETIEKHLSVRQVEQLVKNIASQGAGTPKPAKQEPAKLPIAYRKIEENMASHFSTKVNLQRKKTGAGAITIEFYNDEDLERIMDKMKM
jgi:ParB family transcriptional regulator, chromosome partitioning protein